MLQGFAREEDAENAGLFHSTVEVHAKFHSGLKIAFLLRIEKEHKSYKRTLVPLQRNSPSPWEVAALDLGKLGAKLTELTKDQAHYISIPVKGPYKPPHYRY
ncbi:Adenosylhomocysteinase [Forsythia ovata]|uniref:Adenosylhomocysteinase n=1 Tax=Forsythia ovata TaxID=205694 RepID=A0ABD1SK90_9LAMI